MYSSSLMQKKERIVMRSTSNWYMSPPFKKIPARIVLYPRDVENITGRSGRTARKLLQKIRIAVGKSPDEFVTIQEFCGFYGISEELVREFIKE